MLKESKRIFKTLFQIFAKDTLSCYIKADNHISLAEIQKKEQIMEKNWKLETIAVQEGYTPENGGPRVVPITQSTTFKYDDAQSVAELFDLKRAGFFYSSST